ncbi:MAG: putative toxin-antitoxin system toxin component, PIN family [Nitrospirota bacterium]|nr:putative toxin-antitoxin system toxin component, PIN family [Nitrospirota bacterium]
MRLVLDTNVLIAAFIAHGTCQEVLEHCIYHHEIVGSSFLLDEFHRTLVRKFGYSRSEAGAAEQLVHSRMIIVEPQALEVPACRDPDDDIVLGTALAGACQCLVTGDADLLALVRYRGIDMISPSSFWRYQGSK